MHTCIMCVTGRVAPQGTCGNTHRRRTTTCMKKTSAPLATVPDSRCCTQQMVRQITNQCSNRTVRHIANTFLPGSRVLKPEAYYIDLGLDNAIADMFMDPAFSSQVLRENRCATQGTPGSYHASKMTYILSQQIKPCSSHRSYDRCRGKEDV